MADFIPDNQFVPDAPTAGAPTQQASAPGAGFIPDDQFVSDEDKYGSGMEQVKAGLEGVASGVLGPIAPFIEREGMNIDTEDVLRSQKAHPIISGVGQAAGLVVSSLAGFGEGALMEKAGATAANAVGLAAPTTYAARVGSAAVKGAAEMAVLQSGDEASKQILQDPDAASESAIGNIGLATLLGGTGGAAFTGVVSPLWKATASEPLQKGLSFLQDHMNGAGKGMPEGAQEAADALGVEVPDVIRGANASDSHRANYSDLKRMENPEILNAETKLNKDTSDSVAQSLGVDPAEVSNYSENEAGHDLHDTWQKEYEDKYKPFEAKFAQREQEANAIGIPDEDRLSHYDKMLQDGITKVGTDSPYYKEYADYAQRLLAKDTVGGLDNLRTEIFNRIKGLRVGGDYNTTNALNDIRNSLGDLQESQIAKQASALDEAGMRGSSNMGADLIAERQQLNSQYRNFAQMSDELASNLGVGKFSGAGTLSKKLANDVTPEQLLKKFSIRNNQDFVPFLQKYFPDTLAKVQNNELKNLIKPAVLSAKGENTINVKKLGDIVSKLQAGKSDYLNSVFSPEALQKIDAAQKLQKMIPTPKDSGTPAGLLRNLIHMPASAMSMVAGFLGHSPFLGGVAGYMAQFLGRNVPDAVKLGLLKFAGSSEPIKAEGFKAMVDFMHNSMKGQNLLSNAAKSVMKAGAEVIPSRYMPDVKDRDALDKQVSNFNNNPSMLTQKFNGDLGHYMPNHQMSTVKAATQSIQYLASLKPKTSQPGTLDKPVPPSAMETARYNRALDIANQPALVLKYAKEGTLQPSDIQDIHNLYPSTYKNMVTKLSAEIASKQASGENIPYHTRMGVSLLMGQPLDSSMQPMNIMAAQPMPVPPPQAQPNKGKSTAKLGKTDKSYMTASQSSESDRSNRD